jgi:hypothetical protein
MRLSKISALGLSCIVIITTLGPSIAKANVIDLPASKPETRSPQDTSSDVPTNATNIYLPYISSAIPTNATNIYLPCVKNNSCTGGAPSPFSIEIAGLSDFTPPAGMSKASVDQLRAQQYAELNAEFPTLVAELRDSGAGWARVYIDWSMIQPNSPTDNNWTSYDSWLSQVASAGVQMIATIANPPGWAITNTTPCSHRIRSDKLQDFYNFLTTIINRYKIAPYGIHTWEVLNEPDAINGVGCTTDGIDYYGQYGADYAALLQGAYTVIKTADPSSKVLMGGIADDWFYLPYNDINGDGSTGGKFNRYFTDDIISAGAANSFDAVNFHYFHDYYQEWERWTIGNQPTCGNYTIRDPSQPTFPVTGLDIVAKGSFFLNRLETCYGVKKPLWITEVGHQGINPNTVDSSGNKVLDKHPEGTLDNQARYVFMVYARGLSLGAENITWYALKTVPSVTTYDYQGLLYDSRDPSLDNQPKPAFYAFKTLTHELTGFQFSSTLAAPTDVEAFAFTNPCQVTKIIAWYDHTTGSVPFVLNSTTSVRLVYRPNDDGTDHQQTITDGGPGDLDHTVNGSITISLDLEPVIIQPNP